MILPEVKFRRQKGIIMICKFQTLILLISLVCLPVFLNATCDDVAECIADCYEGCRDDNIGCGGVRDPFEKTQCLAYCQVGCNIACANCSGGGGNDPDHGSGQGGGRGEIHDGIFDPYHP